MTQALRLVPSEIDSVGLETIGEILEYFHPLQISLRNSNYGKLYGNVKQKPKDISSTLSDPRCCSLVFPNNTKILNLLMQTSVTSSSVERANSSLKFIKNPMQSTMHEDRLNALLLLYVHKDIAVDYNTVLDTFSRRNPRKMLLRNPLVD